MSILRTPISKIAIADLEELCAIGARETAELEFKGELPFRPKEVSADRWITHGDRLGDYARDKLLVELIAFANADGGTLIIGLHETDDEPRSAGRLKALPNCEDLARRLLDASEDMIEPRLPLVEGRAIPVPNGDGEGYVVLRVSGSASGPHRLASEGHFYTRRGERSVKMDVREIRERFLELARTGDAIEAKFASRVDAHRRSFDALARSDRTGETHFTGLTVTATPLNSWNIAALTDKEHQRRLWWKGGPLTIRQNGRESPYPIHFPADRFASGPEIGLRSLRSQPGDIERLLTSDGLVEFSVFVAEPPGRGKTFQGTGPLFLDWVVALLAGAIAQVDHLRTSFARDAAEFGLQMIISSNLELSPRWARAMGGSGERFEQLVFPKQSIGPRDTFDDVVNLSLRDVLNHCGITASDPISVDWANLLK
ncbi:RNA-binding domain-containing protein [Mesorhizobium sp.]|uniref:RNA-binding domain-containing protein n=1 Tax=Mesorhizobium sp. TaxID=1871066 RepID=UPI000FE4617B|nr:RNA-binding domain-containing protein [Mesorhizobium sp.]RWE97359.1 MAG: ATP-binding protein [Mesorhizobium sp.]